MFRKTFPLVKAILLSNKRSLLLLIIISVLLGVIPTLKSELEASIFDQASEFMKRPFEDRRMNVFIYVYRPLERFSTENSSDDFVQNLSIYLFHNFNAIMGLFAYIIISFISFLLTYRLNALNVGIDKIIFTELRREGFQKGLITDPSDLPSLPNVSGQYAVAIHQGASRVSDTYRYILQISQSLFSLGTTVFLIATQSVLIAGCCLIIVVAQTILSVTQAKRLEKIRIEYDKQRNDLVARTDDILSKREIILAFEQQDKYTDKIDGYTNRYADILKELDIREYKYSGVGDIINDFGRMLVIASTLIVTLLFIDRESISGLGDVYFILSIYSRILSPISSILNRYDSIKSSEATSRTFLEVISGKKLNDKTTKAPVSANTASASREGIIFEHVYFRYGNGALVLKDCNFEIPANTNTLVVGGSGSGKSTIAKILLGFWPIEKGKIRLLGKDIETWTDDALREKMSYVSQGDYIIDDTVKENLGWGFTGRHLPDEDFLKEMIMNQEMIEALRAVGLIKNDNQFDILDKPAKSLSGGQQQRLSIARMLLDHSEIVILDEPLTGVDVFTLRDILPVMERYLRQSNRTVIMFSHNLTLANYAKHIVVLGDQGKVVEEGDTMTLLHSKGVFSSLYKTAVSELGLSKK